MQRPLMKCKLEAYCNLIAVKEKDGCHKMVEIMETKYQKYLIDFDSIQ